MKSNFAVKCVAVILFAVMLTTALLSCCCLIFGFGSGAFSENEDLSEMKNSFLKNFTWRPMSYLVDYVEHYEEYGKYSDADITAFIKNNMSENLMAEIKDDNGKIVFSNIDENLLGNVINTNEYTFSVLKDGNAKVNDNHGDYLVETTVAQVEEYVTVAGSKNDGYLVETTMVQEDETFRYEEKTITVTVCVKKNLVVKDIFYYTDKLFDALVNKQTQLFIIALLSVAVTFALAVFIMCSAGHKPNSEEICLTKFDKFPMDILTAIWCGLTVLLTFGIASGLEFMSYEMITFYEPLVWSLVPYLAILSVLAVVVDGILLAILLMTTAVRFKTETYIKSTLIYKVLCIIFRILKKCCVAVFGFLKKTIKLMGKFLRSIPLVWKTVICAIAVMLIEYILLGVNWGEYWPLAWIFTGILCAGVTVVAVLLKKIKNGTEEIAKGNIYKKINTKYLFLDMKEHAENINNINDGIAKAVEERMRSERFKTELITNVSHDIKTPLTSIINYVDLLEKEDIDNETAKEYIDVLSRQSAKLKKLIEDLLEASKASTGNISVNLSKFELGILLSQALGEYDERFKNSNLQVVLNKTNDMLFVMADSRHMWRVFDNILNNIAKYAQPNTRVYIDAKRKNNIAEITFRNISKDPLNISGDELMERFVRGDSSRNTEGSGLGLSIAKSLAEVQKGKLDIEIDGDLFKVSLSFPISE